MLVDNRKKKAGKFFSGIKHKLFLLFLLGSHAFGSFAQDTINSLNTDKKSYQLYLAENWPELIKFGNSVIKSGSDYFYLRMRIGIAYYERKNYSLAEVHFKKALLFNTSDSLAQEYLYFCYIFMGRNEEARILSKSFSKELAKKTGTDKNTSIGFVLLEGGTKVSDNLKSPVVQNQSTSNFYEPATYFHAGLNHYIKNSLSVYHAFTYFNQKYFSGSNRQLQYYLKVAIPIKNNWLISPSIHWINKKTTIELAPPQMGPPKKQKTDDKKSDDFAGSLSIQKTIKKFRLSLGTTVSNIDTSVQYYHSGLVSYSVLGNSRLFIGATAYFHTTDNYSTIRTSIAPFIYGQPIKHLSISASYLLNNGNNLIEENGYLVNNSPDLTTSKWSFLANVNITSHIALYALYQLEYKKREAVQTTNYHFNVFIGGLKITP